MNSETFPSGRVLTSVSSKTFSKCLSQSNPVTKCPFEVPLPWCSNPDSWAFRLRKFQQGWSVLHLDLGAGGCCVMSQDHAITFRLLFFSTKKRPQTNLDIQRDGFAWSKFSRRFACHPQAQHHVQRALLLDVVVRQRPPILELLSNQDQTLLLPRHAFLLMDLRLHVVDPVGRLKTKKTWQHFDIQATQRPRTKNCRTHLNLGRRPHTTSISKMRFCLIKVLTKICMPPPQAQHHVQRALLSDVVVRQPPAIVELLFSEERTLLVRRDACPGSWFSRCRSCRTLTCYSESMRAIAAANHRANSWMTHHLDSNCFPLLQQHNIPTCSANAKSHNHQY